MTNTIHDANKNLVLGNFDLSKQLYQEIVNCKSTNSFEKNIANFHLSYFDFVGGNPIDGIRKHIKYGKQLDFINEKIHPIELKFQGYSPWQGQVEEGTTLFLFNAAGLGDDILNFRFIKQIKKLGIELYFISTFDERNYLYDVFSRISGFNSINLNTDDGRLFLQTYPRENTYYTTTYSLFYTLDQILNFSNEDIHENKYIDSDKQHLDKWSSIIKNNGKINIGIRWQGNPNYPEDEYRTLNPNDIINTLDKFDVNVYSFEKEESNTDNRIINLNDNLQTWEDTFAALDKMDVVISSCTSVAHAAAALGKNLFVITPIHKYGFWYPRTGQPKNKSAFYGDNVTVISKEDPHSWESCYKKLHQELQSLLL